jgi:hypothetical protein
MRSTTKVRPRRHRKVNRLAAYLDWVLTGMQHETGSNLAGTRTGELLGNTATAAHELLTVRVVSPRVPGTDQPTDELSTRH